MTCVNSSLLFPRYARPSRHFRNIFTAKNTKNSKRRSYDVFLAIFVFFVVQFFLVAAGRVATCEAFCGKSTQVPLHEHVT
jgi:hypothetical protein